MRSRLVRSRGWGAAVTFGVVLAAAWPVRWPRGRDSFPLSPYPMFARKQVDPTVRLTYAVGVDRDGNEHALGPSYVANSEVLQARAALEGAVRGGRGRIDALCAHIAGEVAADDSMDSIERVRIVTGRHDAVDYLRGKRGGVVRERGQCEVERP